MNAPRPSPWERAAIALLAIGGLTGVGIGAALAFTPSGFRALSGNATPIAAGELSEIRAPGGALIAVGLVMLLGAARPAYRTPALLTTAAMFLGYGAGRIVSVMIDGWPSPDLVGAGAVELVLGLSAVLVLRKVPETTSPR